MLASLPGIRNVDLTLKSLTEGSKCQNVLYLNPQELRRLSP